MILQSDLLPISHRGGEGGHPHSLCGALFSCAAIPLSFHYMYCPPPLTAALSLPFAFHSCFLFHLIFHFFISYLYLTAFLFLCFYVFLLSCTVHILHASKLFWISLHLLLYIHTVLYSVQYIFLYIPTSFFYIST